VTENKNDIDFAGEGDIEYAAEWLEELLDDIVTDECDSGETFIVLNGQQYRILVAPTD